MNRLLRFLLPFVSAAAALGLIAPGVAMAGTYTVTTNTANDVSGWEFTHASGFVGCSRLSYPAVCAANDVARPTPLRIFGSGDAIATGVGLWTWYAPLTTTIVKGSVSVAYKTTAPGTSVYLKARTRSESFESVDKLDQTTGDGSNTWAIPANRQVIGLALRSDVKHTYGDKWANTLRISTLTVTLSDTTVPTVSVTGPLTLGKWLNQAQKVCLTATADDAGAGIASIELDDQSGRALDSYNVPVQSATQPGMPSLKHDLCVVPSTLGDGVHQLKVVARDAASETATQSLAVDVDTDAPTAKDKVPTDRTIDRRAPVSFSVDPGASGLSQFTASLDGVAMAISGARASLQPTADFTLGVHTVQWSATDGAGNVGRGQWTFTVTDALPTSITVSGVHRIIPGRSARLTFRVLGDANAVAGARVLLQTRIGSHAYGVGRDADGVGDRNRDRHRPPQADDHVSAITAVSTVGRGCTHGGRGPAPSACRRRSPRPRQTPDSTDPVGGITPGPFPRAGGTAHTQWMAVGRSAADQHDPQGAARSPVGRYLFRAVAPSRIGDHPHRPAWSSIQVI